MLKCYEISFVIKRKRTPYTIFEDIIDAFFGNAKTPNIQYSRFHFIKDCKSGEGLNTKDIDYCMAYWNERKENKFWIVPPNTIASKEIPIGDFNKAFMLYDRTQIDNYAKMYHMFRVIVDN